MLHHIERPRRLFAEAVRVLRPLGRLILMEPAVTAGSYFFYRFFHPEPFDMSVDPLGGVPLSSPLPYDSNQAIPTLLATCYRHELTRDFPELKLALVRWTSILAYPLSGGLRPWSMVGPSVAAVLLRFEDRVPQSIMRFLAFRILLVLQRDVNEACDPMVTVKVLGSE